MIATTLLHERFVNTLLPPGDVAKLILQAIENRVQGLQSNVIPNNDANLKWASQHLLALRQSFLKSALQTVRQAQQQLINNNNECEAVDTSTRYTQHFPCSRPNLSSVSLPVGQATHGEITFLTN